MPIHDLVNVTKMDDGLEEYHNILLSSSPLLLLRSLTYNCTLLMYTKIRTSSLYWYIHLSYNNKSNAQPSSNQKVME